MAAYTPIGLTPESFKDMQLGAGAFFKDIDAKSVNKTTTAEDFAEILQKALGEGKSLGATTGGGTFTAKPEVRQIEADGMTYPVIGSTVFDSWEIILSTTIKQITKENMKIALATAQEDSETGALIIASTLLPEHYIPSIGWAGRLLDGRLMYIELQNALNTVGMTLTFADKGEGTIAVQFRGHQADLAKMQYAPCRIFFFENGESEDGGDEE